MSRAKAGTSASASRNELLRLERRCRNLEDFAFHAAHDLQAPTRRIIGFCDSLAKRLRDAPDEQAQADLRHLSASAAQLSRIIGDLLTLAQIERGLVREERFSLRDPLDDAMAILAEEFQAQRASVEIAPLPAAYADRTLMTLVFQNLIANALRHSRASALRIRISAQDDRGGVVVTVADNGCGVPRQHQQRIFGGFARLDLGGQAGSGLGLSFCRAAIRRHGGRIWVESKPDAGAAFRLRLPASRIVRAAQNEGRTLGANQKVSSMVG